MSGRAEARNDVVLTNETDRGESAHSQGVLTSMIRNWLLMSFLDRCRINGVDDDECTRANKQASPRSEEAEELQLLGLMISQDYKLR